MSVQLQLFANNATTTLAISITSTDTQLTLTSGSLFPAPDSGLGQFFLITLESSGIIEVIKVSVKSGNVLTVHGGLAGRAQEGTAASNFPVGAVVECRVTKGTLDGFLLEADYLPYIATTTLSPPNLMTSTAYIAGVDDGGAGVMVCATSSTTWSLPNFSATHSGNATTGTITEIAAASLPASGTNGRYIIQFTSGLNNGYVRAITSYGPGTVAWATALPYAITTEGYVVYTSNYSLIQDAIAAGGGAATDEALVYAIAFGS